MTFFKTNPALARALTEHNYLEATPVQSAVLTKDVEARDILVSAQTGSGKTIAYGLAIAATILGEDERMGKAAAPVALIIAPTRELALQVERELTWLYQHAGARIVSCVGGMDSRAERRKLADGAHIVIGTPGRLRDHIERNGLIVSGLAAVVLDEADEMLDLGFREDLEFILEATPASRQTLMFSATMPKGIAALAKRYQRDALRIEVAGGERGHADIEYRAIRVAPNEIEHAVVNLLRFVEAQTAIVFCNTRESVRHLHATLLERGFSAVLLSGELSQHERNQSMQAMRDGRARVCVATDVAARGIDLPNLGLVVHAELPHDAEALQHRSGRTGRAGRKGVSALLVPISRRHRVERLLMDAGVRATWSGPPSADEIRKLDQERLLQDPILTEPHTDEDVEMARLLLAEQTPEQLGAALVRIYRSRLPAVEDVVDPGNGPERRETRGPKSAPVKNPKAPRAGFSGAATWFLLNIGRSKNADPKWLLPMLCRKGNITKQDIGTIRIFENETKIEIAEPVAAQFVVNMRRPGGDNLRIERLNSKSAPASGEAPTKGFKPKSEAKKADRKGRPKP
ncbi:DEAD/DEAH box helicase [Methylovirgula sp. HY1]|uniref:DEAD/DEAH box helicase n=1 Tax=Methylovirgula sp. HY1 TaxID=2822761 RepID=UPI001C5B6E97|nr:DEAD/DEAH box helicase [Methylovirgula sp. HY1]QXX76218.1 ATP-dependent RNA helicase DbpA [Methylovirgula sp. HY1]